MPLPDVHGEEFEFPDEKEAKQLKAQAEEKFEIEIEDDTPVEDRGRKPSPKPPEEVTDDELNSYDEKVQARIKKFTRGYHDERRAKEEALREREAAEVFAKQVFEENKRLQQRLASGSHEYIETSKSAAQLELDAAKKKYKDAYEAADSDALADAQAELTRATLKIDRAAALRPIEVEEKQEYTPAKQASPKPNARTQVWFENNSEWFGKDDEMTMAAVGLDKKLQREYGADYIGSEDYFKTVDKTMRKRFPEYFSAQSYEEDEEPQRKTSEPDEDDTPRRATKPAAVVAPATRSTPPNRVKLKASEVALARKLGVPIELYAKQVAELRKGN